MWLALTGLVLSAGLLRWQLARHFVSEPPYEVLERLGDGVEIRRYEAMVVAETRIEASFDAAPNQGFRRLAGFLFGGNRGGESLAMTAPVTQTGERLAMTVPVTQAVTGDASTGAASVVAFVMPAGRALSSLPIPDDGSGGPRAHHRRAHLLWVDRRAHGRSPHGRARGSPRSRGAYPTGRCDLRSLRSSEHAPHPAKKRDLARAVIPVRAEATRASWPGGRLRRRGCALTLLARSPSAAL